ncbi:MAG: nuclear transport factor 2 family protein [Methanoregula sp.]|nr:nuclear transport factor 2 family protein [Methanoregula sp.]
MADLNTASKDPEQLKNLLVLREHARADAWFRKDRRALAVLLAPDFVEVSSLGRFTKEELLDRLFPVLTLHEFIIEDPGIRITGENTAVLSYRCHERLTAGRKLIEGTFQVFATYTLDGTQYRLSVWEIRPIG